MFFRYFFFVALVPLGGGWLRAGRSSRTRLRLRGEVCGAIPAQVRRGSGGGEALGAVISVPPYIAAIIP